MNSGRQAPVEEVPGAIGTGDPKTATEENFLILGRILDPTVREPILRCHRFMRASDNLIDSPDLSTAEKRALLAAWNAVLAGSQTDEFDPTISLLREVKADFLQRGLSLSHLTHTLQALEREVDGIRHESWSDLMLYCTYGAAPVGRFLLEIHGEPRALWKGVDALCGAHAVLDKVMDCREDYTTLDRVYLPLRWFREAGADIADLEAKRSTPALRTVFDRVIAEADVMLDGSATSIAAIGNRHLRRQAALTHSLGRSLSKTLKRRDPLRRKVKPGGIAKMRALAAALMA